MKRVAIAIIGASLASAAITSIGLYILNIVAVDATDGAMAAAHSAYFLLSAAIVALVSSTLGLAWHAFASSRGWTGAHAYGLPALLVGLAPPQIIVLNAVLTDAETRNSLTLNLWMLWSVYSGALGGLTGLFAWLIRRPDCDASNPPTPAP